MVKDRVILSTLLVVGGFTLLLNVFYILRNDSSTSKWFHITVDQQSDLDLKIAVHSLKAIDHQLETSLKDMKPTTAPTELKAAFHGLPVCPEQPPALVGGLAVNVDRQVELDDVVKDNPGLKIGGFYSPPHCQPRDKVAIIIPFRDREVHLHILLHYMIPILRRQLLQFQFYVVEQAGNCSLNRGTLRNIGAVEAANDSTWQCFCFHDVDMILENDHNLYTCPESPKHLSVATDKFKYKLINEALFGGVVILTKEQFRKINGYSNVYWGWGAEDDDLYDRVKASGMKVIRPDAAVARYQMIRAHHHTTDKENPANVGLLKQGSNRSRTDGLNSLSYQIGHRKGSALSCSNWEEYREKRLESTWRLYHHCLLSHLSSLLPCTPSTILALESFARPSKLCHTLGSSGSAISIIYCRNQLVN